MANGHSGNVRRKAQGGLLSLIFALGLCGIPPLATAQRGEAAGSLLPVSCLNARSSSAVMVRSPRLDAPVLSLCDGHALGGNAALAGQAEPLALAAGDFDGDGVPDLVSGFRAGKGGQITVHRGNVRALWPYSPADRNNPPEAFLPNARVISLPEAPDFLATGDFDADGRWDIVAGQRGSNALYFLRGDGHGSFGAPVRFQLAGSITAMISGEINRTDGLADLIVAVNTANGPRALVYESPSGALKGQPEIFKLPEPASGLALARLDGGVMNDLAIAAGNKLVVIHARDRKLSQSEAKRGAVAAAKVTVQEFAYAIRAIAAGDFTGTGPSVALLDEEGRVHLLDHSIDSSNPQAMAMLDPGLTPTLRVAHPGADGKPVTLGGIMTPGMAGKLAALRESAAADTGTEWTERRMIPLPAGFSQSVSRLIPARVSSSLQEDLLVPDAANSQIHVLSTSSKTRTVQPSAAGYGLIAASHEPMQLLASLQAVAAPAAVLPMRLNQHGLNGLVMLQAGQAGPTVMPQDVPPANVFTVTNTSDAIIVNGIVKTGPAGSLRKAMADSAAASGTSSIVFNIPTTDPGYNPATGTFLFQPLSESVPGAFDNFALPPINATVTIDGYTQPGASPNTLANGDNAKILIQIDGGKATTPGGAGMVPFDSVGSVFRGLDFTGWTNGAISGGTESGAEGIEANGVSDFIEGNFFGADPSGKVAAPNRIGIFADNGPGFGNPNGGNIIGGTTPQARNLLSGNQIGGVLFLSTALEARLQGNFVGTDITGAAALPNTDDGTGLNGPTVTIGGTLPGSGNVISGNGTNVDINDLTEGGAASDSIVQGNLIGTDPTGTKSVSGGHGVGVSILHNPTNMLIGGTTPAARNVIAGNLYGVYVFDNSFFNTIQGNYIGVDVSGAKALGNVMPGFLSGSTGSPEIPAGDTTIGGSVPGAGNVISGNLSDGIQIAGTSTGPNGQFQTLQGNIIQGNWIGTDATGKTGIPNQGNGIYLSTGATNNVIGGSQPGSGNLIAHNTGHGVLIDPGTATPGEGVGNNTIANSILSNSGAGVRIKTGTSNRVSQNSIFGNGALGIDIDAAGPDANTHCNSSNSGANNLQNSPVLTAGSGSAFITATATDPNGNTSEFSNAVAESLSGNVLDLLGTFDSTPNTTFSIEFFSSPTADASGFGEGQTYLGSTTVTTDASCTVSVNDPVDLTGADVSVTLTDNSFVFMVGPDFGQVTYSSTVANNGPATAHNVTFTDTLPSGLDVSSGYCNVGSCQTPVTTTLGTCTVSGKTITCNLGTLAPGATANITIPVQVLTSGSIVNSVSAHATESDPKPANNTASTTVGTTYPFPFIDHLDPVSALTNSPSGVLLTIYGTGLISSSQVTFNGTALPIKDIVDNQVCGGSFSPSFCTGLRVQLPASLLSVAGTATVVVTDPDPGPGGGSNSPTSASFTIASSCTYSVQFFGFNPVGAEGDTLIPESVEVGTNVATCPWSATSDSSWLTILDNATGVGFGAIDVMVAPNTGAARIGHITAAGQAVEIDQAAGDSTICTFTPNPVSAHLSAAGGSNTFAVTTGSSCSYFVQAYPQGASTFITIPQSSGLLVGNGNPSYTVAANHGAPRTGEITIAGDAFAVTQDAPSCYYTLDTTSTTVAASGGAGSIGVTASAPNCSWTAKSSDTSHLTVTSGASGTGNGTVKYSVPVNTDGPQTPTLTIGDANGFSIFSVTQASAFTCTFTISPTPLEVSANGTSNFFALTASFSFCKWTANPSDPSAMTINNSSGTGTSAVYYTVGQNTGGPRTLTIVAGCQTFTVNQDGAQASNPVPAITTLQPTFATAGSGAFTLTVNGTGFISSSVVNFNGGARATTFVSATKLTVAILADDVASVGTPAVTVTNPSPGGGISNAVVFNVTAANNPVPAITTLQPATATAGSGAFTLTVNGTGFISSSVVNFNGAARATTFVSATQVTAAILASDVGSVGTPTVTVTNPSPGGGISNAVIFNVTAANNPVPSITTLQPATATAGSGAFTLTVNGSNFIGSSVVKFNGIARATTFINASQLSAAILASDIASAGTPAVTVTNPAPGGGTSNAVTFTITTGNNPVPAITTLQPATATAGSGAFTLTVNGTGFISSSVVNFNGVAKTTTFVSATQVTAAILASDVASMGTPAVTVTNPSPGGGTSNVVVFSVTAANNPVPAIATLQPTGVIAGSGAFTLTVSGSNFISSSVVKFNGIARATTFVSATEVTAAILAADVASVGTPAVTVTNPSPGGGTSNAVSFSVTAANNPVPAITSLQPTSATAGAGGFTLTVNGSNFISTSVVKFNGAARITIFVSATQLTATILAGDIASAGTPLVTVTNPGPGGGDSNAAPFTVNTANNPVPAIAALLPASAVAGSGALTLTVDGSNFIGSSVVKFNGAARATTFVNATQVTAAILASDIASAGTPAVTVTNPAPGGGTSNLATFTINNPAPIVTTLQPQSVTVGAAAFTLTVNGSGFNASSVVTFGGAAKTTSLVSSTQLSAAIAADDVAVVGTVPVSVTNPTPGGGTAAAVNFAIASAGTPQASLNPAALAFPNTAVAALSSAQTITLSNTGSAALSITGITIAGANPADFAQTNNCPSSLAAGSNCAIAVTFSPVSATSFSASLSVADNASGSPQLATLSGTGFIPTAPIASITPTSLSFSAITGTTAAAQTATLKNTGNAPLTIKGITLTGTNSSDFAQTNTCGSALAEGENCAISVTFTPASVASFAATVSIADNATGSPQTVSLTGTGTAAPSFTVSSSTAAQTIQAGGSAVYSVTVAAQNGTFANPVTLTASGLPTGATATFVPATLTPGSGSSTSQLTIQTASTVAAASTFNSGWKFAASMLPLLGLFFATRRFRRRWMTFAILLLGSLGAVGAISGCGGGFSFPGSTAKTYSITITGTSGAITQSTSVRLIVK